MSLDIESSSKAVAGETPACAWDAPAAGPEPEASPCEPIGTATSLYRRILVPVDGSVTAERGLTEAIKLAVGQGATLRVLYVLSKAYLNALRGGELLQHIRSDAQAILSAAVARARNEGVSVESAVIEHSGQQIGEAIIAEAQRWRADLTVMGTHGRRGLDRAVMGSDAEYVLRHACTPVLLLRA